MKLYKSLSFWVITALISGSIVGIVNPQLGVSMELVGTNFIKLIKLFIAPIVFLTVTIGIAQTGSLKSLGKISLKAIIYFEIVSTIALCIGWAAATLFKPGTLVHADVNLLSQQQPLHFLEKTQSLNFADFLHLLIPNNIIEPFIKSDMLQILVLAILFGTALLAIGNKQSAKLLEILTQLTESIFQVIRIVMYAAPIGVFGAIAFTVGKFGAQFLLPLFNLIATFYMAAIFFVLIVLGGIAYFSGFSILRFLRFIFPELLLILGTSSSEPVLPVLLKKLEKLGCKKQTVGVVVPMGYSFNLDGTSLYLTLGALFIAQALGIQLTLTQQLELFSVALFSSKGTAGVSGTGFIMLATTLSIVPSIPVTGIVLLLGVDRFMSEARSLTNFIGNGVAALVISRWQNDISAHDLNQALLQVRQESLTTQIDVPVSVQA